MVHIGQRPMANGHKKVSDPFVRFCETPGLLPPSDFSQRRRSPADFRKESESEKDEQMELRGSFDRPSNELCKQTFELTSEEFEVWMGSLEKVVAMP